MSNNKQSSSINFFWNQLPEILPFTVETETAVKLLEAFEQAKAMEKQQIIDAHNHGFTEGTCFGASPIGYKFIESEQYYNETYGK